MEAPSSATTIESPPSPDAYDAKNEDPFEDETHSSVENESSSKKETEETGSKTTKRSKKSSSKKTDKASGNYNRYFLSNFKIENIFSFNKKHDFRISQNEVGLILGDPSAFEKLQAHLRQEGCVTDGTIRVNYNDLLRTRLLEIEETREESKEELSYSGTSQGLLDEVAHNTVEHERRRTPESYSQANAISGSLSPGIPDSECVTPARESRPQEYEEADSFEDRNSKSSFRTDQDQATKSSASSSPTSVLEMMDLEMKHIDQIEETFETNEEELYGERRNVSDDEFADDSSVDSGLFVENRTFSRPAASAPVIARPWGSDSATTKEEKIWDICAVEAPATTMDFDHLWEDDDNSEVDISPYRRDPYDSSSDDDIMYNDAHYSSQSKKELSERIGSSNGESWQSNSVRADEIEFIIDAHQTISREAERKGHRVRFSMKKQFAYPSPGHEMPESRGSHQTQVNDLRTMSGGKNRTGAITLPKKRISRRQKRQHVVETLEI